MLEKSRSGFQKALLAWFHAQGRHLPWRDDPSPYRVLVSEFMLQQTTVAAVLPYFDRWMRALPDVAALAAAPEEKILKLWEGLGYYSRARNLHRAAKAIVQNFDGKIPSDLEQLRGALAQLEELEQGDLRSQERALIDLDSRIHRLIYQATKNAYLATDLDRYYIHSQRIWNLGLGRVEHLRQAVLEHKELLEAIIQGDSDRAFNVMSKHVSEFEAEIAQAL